MGLILKKITIPMKLSDFASVSYERKNLPIVKTLEIRLNQILLLSQAERSKQPVVEFGSVYSKAGGRPGFIFIYNAKPM